MKTAMGVARALLLTGVASLAVTLYATPARAGQDPLNYRLKWLLNVSTIGDVWADTQGLFKAQGLAVAVKPGGPERNAIRELELGHADFGVASADQVIRALGKGSPVVVVAQLFQVNPLQWMARGDRTPLRRLSDLKGRTIGVTFGGNDETIMRTLLAQAGIGESDVKLFSVRYDYTPFYRGRVDLWPVYRNAQGPIIARRMEKAGDTVVFFDPAGFGVRFVANSVVTTEKRLRRRPELVRRFVRTLLSGWRQALDPSSENRALQLLQQVDPDTPAEVLAQQLEITRRLVRPTGAHDVGKLDVAAWRQTEAILLRQGQIPAPVDVARVLVSDLLAE